MDATIIETFFEDNEGNVIKINSDEDNDLNSENPDVEMNSNDKNNNKINLDSSLDSDNDCLVNLVEKEKNYEDISKNYTLSVYVNLIENIDNLDISNNIITDNNNTLSKNLATARKRKTDEDDESPEKYWNKSKDDKRKKYPKFM